MKVLIKGLMPDGTKIQIEDWSNDYPTFHKYGDLIAAYPKIRGQEERVQLDVHDFMTAMTTFKLLESGALKAEECAFTGMRCARPVPLKKLLEGD